MSLGRVLLKEERRLSERKSRLERRGLGKRGLLKGAAGDLDRPQNEAFFLGSIEFFYFLKKNHFFIKKALDNGGEMLYTFFINLIFNF